MTYQEALDIIKSYRHTRYAKYPEQVKAAILACYEYGMKPWTIYRTMNGVSREHIRRLLGLEFSTKVDPSEPLPEARDGYVKTLVYDDGVKPERCPKCGSTATSSDLYPVHSEHEDPAWIWTWKCCLCSYSPNKAQRILTVKEKA